MSISTKKIQKMLEEEFSPEAFEENSDFLTRLAKDIYAIENSYGPGSDKQKIDDIQSNISMRSKDFIIK